MWAMYIFRNVLMLFCYLQHIDYLQYMTYEFVVSRHDFMKLQCDAIPLFCFTTHTLFPARYSMYFHCLAAAVFKLEFLEKFTFIS